MIQNKKKLLAYGYLSLKKEFAELPEYKKILKFITSIVQKKLALRSQILLFLKILQILIQTNNTNTL